MGGKHRLAAAALRLIIPSLLLVSSAALASLTSFQSAPAGAGETEIKAACAYDLLNQRTGLTNADNPFTISKPWVTPCYFFCFLECCAGEEREPASHNTAKIHQAPDGISLVIRIATKA